jgi:hypothetical protein
MLMILILIFFKFLTKNVQCNAANAKHIKDDQQLSGSKHFLRHPSCQLPPATHRMDRRSYYLIYELPFYNL